MEALVIILIIAIILGALLGGKSFGGTIKNGLGCLVFIVIGLFLLILIMSPNNKPEPDKIVSSETTQHSASVEPSQTLAPAIECEGKKPANDLIMDVIGSEHLLYTLPNNSAPAVVNIKATEIFGRTHYHQIDSSTRVKIKCDKGEWVFVQLTMPEWLTHVQGWTKSEYLQPLRTETGEPTKALDSDLSLNNVSKISTSTGLTKADLAWHAINTYGFDCTEVLSKSEMTEKGYFLITCSSGIKLRVYPRKGQHPNITDK